MHPTVIIDDVGVKRYPKSVSSFLFSGFRIIGRARVPFLGWVPDANLVARFSCPVRVQNYLKVRPVCDVRCRVRYMATILCLLFYHMRTIFFPDHIEACLIYLGGRPATIL
jgi:hypothetical protein